MLVLPFMLLVIFAAILSKAINAKKDSDSVFAVTIGNGIAGSTAIWEMAQRGLGKADANKLQGLLLIERSDNAAHTCGIIEAINFEESSGLKHSPFSNKYKPYRYTTHAMRINIAQMTPMRCLAHELNLTLYFSPWQTDFRLNGYKSLDGMYECAANSPIPNGFSSSCRGLCREGYRNTMYESDPTCSTHMGASDMILQTTTKAHAPFNIWNYDPEHNYNQGDFDATDEFFGWVLGFANYYNPTANYSGKGTAYNGASIYPFQPSNPSQDHPRHRCRRFKDLYSMYQYYVGPDYAKYLVEVNVGFHADLSNQVDPCTYIGSSTEVGYFAYGYFQVDEGYPVGSMTELCTRQRYLAEHNSMGVAVTTVNGESVVTIDYNDPRNPLYDPQRHKGKGRYVVTTTKRVVFTDNVFIAAEPTALLRMTGGVVEDILKQPEFKVTNPIGVLTITLHWKSGSNNFQWMDAISKTLVGSYRMINSGSCVNRIEILNEPYHRNGIMRGMRVTYSDEVCQKNLLGLAALDGVDGYESFWDLPVDGAVAKEEMRELRQLFLGADGGPYSHEDLMHIPPPNQVVFSYQPNSWYYFKGGNPFSMAHMSAWAAKPLANEKVALIHQAWNVVFSGWAYSSVNQTREAMLKMFPGQIHRKEYRTTCSDQWGGADFAMPVYEKPCDPTKLPSEQDCDAPYAYSIPALGGVTDYANVLSNERHPPYDWEEPIMWQPTM